MHGAPRVAGPVAAEWPGPAVPADAGVVLAVAVRPAVQVAHARLAVVPSPPAGAHAPGMRNICCTGTGSIYYTHLYGINMTTTGG